MKGTSLEKRGSISIKEKSQYALAFGVIAVMLFAVGFPVFLFIFFGVLAFFVWKIFSPESRTETRKIFEFYLSANEILREDDRRWYGFELQEAINRGETIIRMIGTAPPLVHFGLGALYQKIGDHSAAAKHLTDAIESPTADELSVVFPPKALREYVRLLRRIERAPAESPLTSAAVRSLERARKNRGQAMLEHSRSQSTTGEQQLLSAEPENEHPEPHETMRQGSVTEHATDHAAEDGKGITYRFADFAKPAKNKKSISQKGTDRQTISEVLHDIYDKNAQ